MCMGRAQNVSVREARQYEVVGKAAATGKEARIFGARHRLAQRELHRYPPIPLFSTAREDISSHDIRANHVASQAPSEDIRPRDLGQPRPRRLRDALSTAAALNLLTVGIEAGHDKGPSHCTGGSDEIGLRTADTATGL